MAPILPLRPLLALLLLAPACLRGTYNDTETATSSDNSSGESSTATGDPTSTATTDPDSTTGPAPDCGDGVLNKDKGEQCDDGADNGDTKACTADCQLNVCGDGKQGPEDECDDGAGNADNKACTTMCKPNVCGDGLLLDGVELCDDGANNDDALYGGCTTQCQPGPRCGDGVVNGEEACDDGNDDDEDLCSNACVAAEVRFVFVTAGVYSGKLGGLDNADGICDVAAGLNDVGSPDAIWAAWLSDSDTSAASRMDQTFTGWYVLPTSPPTLVAKGWAGLASANHLASIDRTETGATVDEAVEVWTNTTISGDIRDPAAHCSNWTSSGAQQESF